MVGFLPRRLAQCCWARRVRCAVPAMLSGSIRLPRQLGYVQWNSGVSATSSQSGYSGVLGLGFNKPQDFVTRANEVVGYCQSVRHLVSEMSPEDHPPRVILEYLDSVSRDICSVIDCAEFVRNAHQEERYRLAADNAFQIISKLISELNADTTLFDALSALYPRLVSDKTARKSSLTAAEQHITSRSALPAAVEDRLLAADLLREFEADGVNLPKDMKILLSSLQEEAMLAEMRYARGVQDAERGVFTALLPHTAVDIYGSIQNWLERNGISQDISESNCADIDGLPLVLTVQAANVLLTSVPDELVRETIFRAVRASCGDARSALGDLIIARRNLAKFLGFESYAHKYLANKVYKTPCDVMAFLRAVNVSIAPRVRDEYRSLQDTKQRVDAGGGLCATQLQLWDVPWLTRVSRDVHNSVAVDMHELVEYFPIDAVLSGLAALISDLFGLSVTVSEVSADEAWCNVTATDNTPLLYKMIIRRGDGDLMATVYLDLFARAHKASGAAHFNIRSACTNIRAGQNVILNTDIDNSNAHAGRLTYRERQAAVVAVTMAISHPTHGMRLPDQEHSTSTETATCRPACLTYSELQGLYHEMGHTLHTALSATHYQHLAGTRGPVDYAEIPSHLFEYFARDPRVLCRWARHCTTGQKMPAELLEAVATHRSAYGAMQTQQQLLYAAIDQAMFGTNLESTSCNPEDTYLAASSVAAALHRELLADTYPPPVSDCSTGVTEELSAMNLLLHNHFVGYGGGYYCYTFSKMCAAQIWEKHLSANPLSRDAGLLLYERLFGLGAAMMSEDIMGNGLLGSASVDPNIYLRRLA